jgi:hypothetical protein
VLVSGDLLRISLQAAVPLWIEDMRDWSLERRGRAAASCSQAIDAYSTASIFGTDELRAKAFNKLALGIACGAYQPGGITFLGDHWEAGA